MCAVTASLTAVFIGVTRDSVVLLGIGAIGCVDAVGSVALTYHFRHGIRHEALSEHLEARAHSLVTGGLLVVGLAVVVMGGTRLAMEQTASSPMEGVVLAAASLAALMFLSLRKSRIAVLVSSDALKTDGHLSAVGAAQASVALIGTALGAWLGWEWVDPVAAIIVGLVAISVAIVTRQS